MKGKGIINMSVQVAMGSLDPARARALIREAFIESGPDWARRFRSWAQERFDQASKGGGDWAPLKASTLGGRRLGGGTKKSTTKAGKERRLGIRTRALKAKRTLVKAVGRWEAAKTRHYRGSASRSKAIAKASAAADKAQGRFGKLRQKIARGITKAGILRDTGTLFGALDPTFSARPGQYCGVIERGQEVGIEVGIAGPARHPSSKYASVAEIASFHQYGTPKMVERPIVILPPEAVLKSMSIDSDRNLQRLIDKEDRAAGAA